MLHGPPSLEPPWAEDALGSNATSIQGAVERLNAAPVVQSDMRTTTTVSDTVHVHMGGEDADRIRAIANTVSNYLLVVCKMLSHV